MHGLKSLGNLAWDTHVAAVLTLAALVAPDRLAVHLLLLLLLVTTTLFTLFTLLQFLHSSLFVVAQFCLLPGLLLRLPSRPRVPPAAASICAPDPLPPPDALLGAPLLPHALLLWNHLVQNLSHERVVVGFIAAATRYAVFNRFPLRAVLLALMLALMLVLLVLEVLFAVP